MSLTAEVSRTYELGDLNDLPVLASTKIYEGAAVGISSGYARPLAAGDDFVGFADRTVDNSDGSSGDVVIPVKAKGRIKLPVSSAAIGNINDGVYADGDNSFTITSSGHSLIGYIRRHITGTTCIVEFKPKEG